MSSPLSTTLVTARTILAADLVAGGTVTVGIPAGFSPGHFSPLGHKASVVNGGNYVAPRDFTVAFGVAGAVITSAAGMSAIPAGSEIIFEFNIKGSRGYQDPTTIAKSTGARLANLQVREINLGMPVAAAVAAAAAVQLLGSAGALALNGPLSAGGVVTFDVPRAVTLSVAVTNQSAVNFTITGTDEFGNVMVETLAGPNANTVTGNKAFKTITSIVTSAAIATNGVSVGSSTKLGLPVYLPNAAFILKELQDGANAAAGTTVAGVVIKQTATTGDVRGTYIPNVAPDGTKAYSLIVALEDPNYTGSVQFAG